MTQRQSRTFRAFIYALAVHIVVITILLINLELTPREPSGPTDTRIVQAVAVDQNKVEAETRRLQELDKRKQEEEIARQEKLREEEEAARRRREEEERRLAKLKEEQTLLESKRREEEERLKQAEEERKLEEQKKREAEHKRREAEQKALAEKKKAEEEKKRLTEERRKQEKERERRERELQEALAEEERKRAEAEQQLLDQSEIERYTELIKARVERAFRDPVKGLRCKIFVRMIPGGEVVEAKVVQSSGNPNFDRQAEIAVRKAAPLPVPHDPRLFQKLREIYFDFEPMG